MSIINYRNDLSQKFKMKASWGIRRLYNWNENQRLPILRWEKFMESPQCYY